MLLKSWYKSEDKQWRLLTALHNISLNKGMEDWPGESQMIEFGASATQLMSLYHQLQNDHHTDRNGCDRLMRVVDTTDIQNAPRDRTPHTFHELINPVANRFSTRAGTSFKEANMPQKW